MFSKAPWSHSKEEKPQDGGENSLTTILSEPEDRANLLMLVADCVESMRGSLSKTFDPNETGLEPEKPDTEDLEPLVKSGDGTAEMVKQGGEATTEASQVPPEERPKTRDSVASKHEFTGGIVMEDLDGDEESIKPPHQQDIAGDKRHSKELQPDASVNDGGLSSQARAEQDPKDGDAPEEQQAPPALPRRHEEVPKESSEAVSDMADLGIGGSHQDRAMTDEETARIEETIRKKKEEKARKEYQQRVEEINTEQMQEIKKQALTFFDDWRDRVYVRVGHAINDTEHQAEPEEKGPALPPRRPAPSSSQPGASKTEVAQDDPSLSSDVALHTLYPPHTTTLLDRPQAQRILILHSLLLLLLSLETYPSHSRILLLNIASSLHLPLHIVTDDESKVARGLLEAAKRAMSADEETQKKASDNIVSRRWKVGLGAVAGAALIGITGGLAAPLLAAGVGTMMGGLGLGATAAAGYLGALAGSAPLVGALFGAYGGRMTGKMVDNYAREVEDFAFLPTTKSKSGLPNPLADSKDARRLRVVIGISGWLTSEQDVSQPWLVLSPAGIETFALRWELEALIKLGNAMTSYIKSAAWNVAKAEIIKRTIFGALAAGLWPITMLSVGSRVVDNPFSIAKTRADKAGAVLADAIINKAQGERPVTLVGYSLGARVIYACLNTLADRRAFGLVESVVLLGAACPSDSAGWRKARSVVGARVVNVYSTNDYLLGFLYRTSSLQYGIAGLQAVRGVAGVENVDVSELVDGHTKYRYLTGAILEKVGFEDIDKAEVSRQTNALVAQEAKDREEQASKADGQEKDADAQAEELEREIEQKNKSGPLNWMSDKMSNIKLPARPFAKTQAGENDAPSREDKTELAKQQEASMSESSKMRYAAT